MTKGFKLTWPRRKTDTQTPRNNHLILYASLSIGLMGTGFLLSPLGKVNEIYVEGGRNVPEQLVLDASGISHHQTALGTLASERAIEAAITSKLPQVGGVQVKAKNLHDIVLVVKEFETIAYLHQSNRYHSVLENGVILNESLQVPIGNNPLLTAFEQGPILNEFITVFRTISEEVQNSISEISYKGTKTNPYKIMIYMNDGNHVLANINDFSKKIVYYPDIVQKLEEKKGLIDMEVGVFFTPFGSSGAQEVKVESNSEE